MKEFIKLFYIGYHQLEKWKNNASLSKDFNIFIGSFQDNLCDMQGSTDLQLIL